MSIKIGNKNIKEIKYGSKSISKIYFGSKLIYQKKINDNVINTATLKTIKFTGSVSRSYDYTRYQQFQIYSSTGSISLGIKDGYIVRTTDYRPEPQVPDEVIKYFVNIDDKIATGVRTLFLSYHSETPSPEGIITSPTHNVYLTINSIVQIDDTVTIDVTIEDLEAEAN